MRLFNIKTLKLEYFQNVDAAPPYAILSHRWEEEEILFRDIKDKHPGSALALSHPHLRRALVKKGWQKVEGFCRVAKRLGLSYAWVDTFCIDQSSSSELSESINSMFVWYQNAKVCIAYLYDVTIKGDSWDYNHYEGVFDNSSWFRRGWTLQELIAPKEIWFFKRDWSLYGIRSELADRISEITKIDKIILREPTIENLNKFSVAARLSWAAGRITTRREDRAYSLMGLFGVNIPTIYGEGQEAAFFRLQSEIFQKTSDHSIFAWKPATDSAEAGLELFAQSPDAFDFDEAGTIVSHPALGTSRANSFSMLLRWVRARIIMQSVMFGPTTSETQRLVACKNTNSSSLWGGLNT
ncbi:HET-domain-containing protein [Glonium stellatum]|uniref:HET-domain-containing protein n=1 Tax=Glonium stellatum TaxID=574774 RepID=A0A8E2ET39_9PEZI|nr:HET-domain-containing protein [Glonium stellatum]